MDERALSPSTEAEKAPSRGLLVQEHLSLVYHVARRINKGRSGEVELEELVSAGTLGLIDAIEKFDESRGLQFSTFAVPRIRGAILDELRRLDAVPRSLRQKQRALEQARRTLGQRLSREPNDEELAAELGLDADTLWRWTHESESTVSVSLDGPARDESAESPRYIDGLEDHGASGADEMINREEELSLLRDEIASLEEQERTVLALYYYEEMKLREIGEVLDLTVSRISQIRTGALKKLRGRLAPLMEM